MTRTTLIRFPAIFLTLLLSGAAVHADERTIRVAGLAVTVWSDDVRAIRQPVIIFSHGFHGCATQSRFLMEALAAAGYVVFAPNHKDATCGSGDSSWAGKPELPFRQSAQWNEATFRERSDDVRRLIDGLQADEGFQRRVDWSRLGLAGHSLGGYTALGLGGAWQSWKLSNVRAVLALSPYTAPFVDHHTLSQLSMPVMYQGGTRDLGVTPTLHKSMGAYDQTTASKYYVEFDKAGHFAWTNLVNTSHDGIVTYSLAFLNHYVKGDRPDPALTRKLPGVARFQFSSELGSSPSTRK